MIGNHYDFSKFVPSFKKSDSNNSDLLDGNSSESDSTSVFPEFDDYDHLKDLLKNGEKDLAKCCIQKGCRLNKDCADYSYDGTPLHLAISLEYPDIVELLLEKGADTESLNDTKDSPLILAAIVGNNQIIDMILSKSKPANYSNRQGLSHFHIACMRNNVDLVKKFLTSGADINEAVKKTSMFWPGFTPLHFAVEFKSIQIAELLLDRGADITIQDSRDSTPLHLAFRKRNRILTELLISKQYYYASNPVDPDGLSHFYIACTLNKKEIAKDFLDKKIDVKHRIPYGNYQTWHDYDALKFAVDNQCINVLEYLLKCDAVALGRNGLPIMDYAYDNRSQNILNLIISFMEKDMVGIQSTPPLVNSLKNEEVKSTMRRFSVSQYTELHVAVLQKNKDHVNSILDVHHPSIITVTDTQGKTPLHLAFETDQKDLVDKFLTLHLEFDENPTDSNHVSHFHISCATKNVSIVEDFIKKGVDINMAVIFDSPVWAGYTPLHLAIVHGRIKVVELLLCHGADFTAKNTFDISPYDLAIPDSYDEFIINYDDENNGIWYLVEQILLTNQHRKIKNFDDRGITLLHIASAKGDIDMINRHIRADTINKTTAEDLLTWGGFTPLHLATFSGQKHAAKVLLNFGADPTIQDCDNCVAGQYLYTSDNTTDDRLYRIPKIVYNNDGISIFHIACQFGNLKAVQYFLGIEADVHKRIPHGCNNARHGDEGKTPLHLAVEYGSPEIVKLLLEHGANVNAIDCHFNTLLHCCRNEDVLKILLDHGADPEFLNFSLISALEKPLYHYPRPEQITAIIENGGDINKKGLNFINTLEPSKSTILARHIERLTVLGFNVNEQNRDLYDNIITNDDAIRHEGVDYRDKCAKELNLMKEIKVDGRTTLYDILFKSSIEMVKYSKKETLRRMIDSEQDLRRNYPIYAYLVILQFKKGVKRTALLEEGKRSLSWSMNRWIDEFVFEIILEFMNDHEIMYLNYASSGQNIFQ